MKHLTTIANWATSLGLAMFCILMTLKLISANDWSWWIVCAPLLPLILCFIVALWVTLNVDKY
jgi:Flp pilus assembly protein protease CpaA